MDRESPTFPGRPADDNKNGSVRSGFLADASRVLAGSLDYEDTLATVAGMALPHLGAWCFVDVLEPDGRMRRLAVIHPDPEKQTLARRLESGWPPAREDPFGVPHAMRTGRSEIVHSVSAEMLAEASHNEENLGILRRLGIGSLMIVPLMARSEVLGAITYVAPSEGDGYGDVDLELAEDLAARCAIAIDNARLFREARLARDAAEAASRAKSEFLATMSHEIRTPINAVVGYVDLLETGIAGALTPDQGRYLERIKASNRHLLGLINEVLDLAKADAGRLQIQAEEATVGPVVDDALDLVRPLVEGRALMISEACEGDPEIRLIADVDRLRQVLVNLLTNAIKFTPDGGRIRISCAQADHPDDARVAAEVDVWTCIRVEDTGIGIDEEETERLFEPFVQADTGYTRSQEGTGLGLAISRRLVRLMDGDLTLESRPGEGSTFTVWLPAPTGEERQQPRKPTRDQAFRGARPVQGVAPLGARLRTDADRIAGAFVRRLRSERLLAQVDELSDAVLQDHTASLLTDLGQTLVLLEEPMEQAAEILRDGSAVQRTITDRHGLQRHRIGWTEPALEKEFDLLREEVERAVRGAAQEHPGTDADRALDLIAGLLHQAKRGSLRAFRMAARDGQG